MSAGEKVTIPGDKSRAQGERSTQLFLSGPSPDWEVEATFCWCGFRGPKFYAEGWWGQGWVLSSDQS